MCIRDSGCTTTDSIDIVEESIRVELPAETLLKRGESVVLHPKIITSSLPNTYEWSPFTGLSNAYDSLPVDMPDQTTEYRLRAETPGGCLAEDIIRVTVVERLYLPDAFSPNGDCMNDVLSIQNGQELIQTIQIYNRWGEIIFFEKGYGVPWDGYYKNKLVANGIYSYVIQVLSLIHI